MGWREMIDWEALAGRDEWSKVLEKMIKCLTMTRTKKTSHLSRSMKENPRWRPRTREKLVQFFLSSIMFLVSIGWDSNRHGSANPSTRIIIFFTWNLLPIRSPLCLTRDDSNPNQFIFIDVCCSFRFVFSSYSSMTSSFYLIESIERRRRRRGATSILMRAKKKGKSNTFVKRNGERAREASWWWNE